MPRPPKHLQLIYKAPAPKINTGLRGNHNHGRKLYDQVYPTTKIPTSFIPRYPLDWRNAGRFILTSALARIENKRIYSHPQSLDYQSTSHCGPRCANTCCNSHYKCLCSMRTNELYTHISSVDSMLMSYKAPIDTKKPLFTVLNYVPKKNQFLSNKLTKDDVNTNSYKIIRKTYKYPVFQYRANVSTSIYTNLLPKRDPYNIFDVKSS